MLPVDEMVLHTAYASKWSNVATSLVTPRGKCANGSEQRWVKRGNFCPIGELDGCEVSELRGEPSERREEEEQAIRIASHVFLMK